MHYDFRLEMDGVLKSWAVPKGLPWKQGEKHLAVEVEDHPIEYETFEGVIPQGNYGGGTVMVWDRGNYYVYGEKPLEALGEGRLHMVLEQKVKGDWALIRTRSDGGKNQWLLLKSDADVKPISKKRRPIGQDRPDHEADRGGSRRGMEIESPGERERKERSARARAHSPRKKRKRG